MVKISESDQLLGQKYVNQNMKYVKIKILKHFSMNRSK